MRANNQKRSFLKHLIPKRIRRKLLFRNGPRRTRPPAGMPDVLGCWIVYNDDGAFCVPQAPMHRRLVQTLLRGDVWEPDTLDLMVSRVGSGDIVHAGAHFGDFLPRLSRALTSDARIWAFEPSPENHRCARITIELNGLANVELMNAGLAEAPGELTLQIEDAEARGLGGSSHVPVGEPTGRTVEVQVVRVDDVVPGDRNISVFQLDVEGAEPRVLSGAMKTIERCRPVLVIESIPLDNPALEPLYALGYRHIGDAHWNRVFDVDSEAATEKRGARPA